jgi:arginine utilization regulatory protein
MNAPQSKDSRFSEPSMEAAHHSPFFHGQRFPGKADLPMQQTQHERELIHDALLASRGNVSAASRALGISRQRLHYKMKKYAMNRLDYMR